MKLFNQIIAQLKSLSGLIIAVTGILSIAWMAFKYVDAQESRNKLQNDDHILITQQVIPRLDSLMAVDSLSALRDLQIIAKLDSTTRTVNIIARKQVEEIRNDSTLTRQEFIEAMDGLWNYLEVEKKNKTVSKQQTQLPLSNYESCYAITKEKSFLNQ